MRGVRIIFSLHSKMPIPSRKARDGMAATKATRADDGFVAAARLLGGQVLFFSNQNELLPTDNGRCDRNSGLRNRALDYR